MRGVSAVLEGFPWWEEVEFHSPSAEVLCVTFLSTADEVCMDGRKLVVTIEKPSEYAPEATQAMYEVARLRYFVEYVARSRIGDKEMLRKVMRMISGYFTDIMGGIAPRPLSS